MKRLLLGIAILLLLLVAVVTARTAMYRPLSPDDGGSPAAARLDPLPGDVERFAGSLRFRTVSHQDPAEFDSSTFAAFREYLMESFPEAHRVLEREVVGEHALLYTWPGRDPSLRPLVLMGHYDVVGVDPGTAGDWEHPPFGGVVSDGVVWGRGAMDNKANVLGALEAVETLARRDDAPERTVILAFGHDEEVGGAAGAVPLVERLAERGVEPELVLDEGGFIARGLLGGVVRPVALIGVAEKGYMAVRLTTTAEGGHGSVPPPQTAAGVIAAAVAALEENQLPTRLTPTSRVMFDRVGREMPLGQRVALANLWLFEPVVLRGLAGSPPTNSIIRTTTAATMLEGSIKENVLPTEASAVINFRILPGDSIAGVVEHVRDVVGDERVDVEVLGFSSEPSAAAPTDHPAYDRLRRAIRAVAPEALITPYLVMGATDARHYTRLTDRVYRFVPVSLTPETESMTHGTNERLSVEDYRRVVDFYARLIREPE